MEEYEPAPDYGNIKDRAFEDHDVLMNMEDSLLIDQGSRATISPAWGLGVPAEEDEFKWDRFVHALLDDQDQMRFANLHPAKWFLAFRPDRMSDHV